ncbi:hypothetical protein AGMMS50293_14120 [Spirochaetia bacterium]|nr:hypothetical protein AGMMS50293_14120 [Spirochaetia bacterium]
MTIHQYMKTEKELWGILRELPMEVLDQIEIKSWKTGDFLIKKGQYDNNLYIILKGVCDIIRSFDTGISLIYYKISKLDIIGFTELVGPPIMREADVVARTEVTAALIPQKIIQACFGKYQIFSVQIALRIINRLHNSIGLFAECNNYSVNLSVVTYLLHAYYFYKRQYSENYDGPVKIFDSRQEMADLIGIDIRSVNRVITKLKNNSFLKIIKGKIHIDKSGFIKLYNLKMADSF